MLPDYLLPPLELLGAPKSATDISGLSDEQCHSNLELILHALSQFGVSAIPGEITIGTQVTRYEVHVAAEGDISKLKNLQKDLARVLRADRISIVGPVPGKGSIGIDVPILGKIAIPLKTLIESRQWQETTARLPIALGKDVYGKPMIMDLAAMPHLLMGGTTGSGKSISIHCILMSLMLRFGPDQLRLVLIDAKQIEMQAYSDSPFLHLPIATSPKMALRALLDVINEIERRYKLWAAVGVDSFKSFNSRPIADGGEPLIDGVKTPKTLPYFVVVVDDLSEVLRESPGDVEKVIKFLINNAQDAGIHLITATQPHGTEAAKRFNQARRLGRMAFQTTNDLDSRAIIGAVGAEDLMGEGDFLFRPPGSDDLIHGHSPFVSESEVRAVVQFTKDQGELPFEGEVAAENYPQRTELTTYEIYVAMQCLGVIQGKKNVTAGFLQRRLGFGIRRASMVMAYLERGGLIGPDTGKGTHQVLVEFEDETAPEETHSTLQRVTNDQAIRQRRTYKSEENVTPSVKEPSALDLILRELNSMTGLAEVKEDLRHTVLSNQAMLKRRAAGFAVENPSYHTVFTGSPGTGKTTVARLMGKAYQTLGVLKRGHVVEVSRSDLVADYIGQTATKTRKKLQEALDGILFIDEAYTLSKPGTPNDFGSEAIDEILQFMENHRDRLIVIAAGYEDRMVNFINANPGLQSRFNKFLRFEDFKPPELASIFEAMASKGNYLLSPALKINLLLACHRMYEKRDEKFGNARDIRKLFENIQGHYLVRTGQLPDLNPPMEPVDMVSKDRKESEDILSGHPEFILNCPQCQKEMLWAPDLPDAILCPECRHEFAPGWGVLKGSETYRAQSKQVDAQNTLAELIAELDGMTGLASVKARIKQLVDSVKIQQLKRKRGLPAGVPISLHMVFSGSPGTGKTTVARLVGKIFRAMGLLTRGHFVEVDRSKLIGGYVGQTEQITSQRLDEALDGILFIDEAYSLVAGGTNGNDFGQRAIETILKRMEDSRDRLVVIAAGYQNDIKSFLESNSGLASRFPTHLLFEDYTPVELLYIADSMTGQYKMTMEDPLRSKMYEFFISRYELRNESFSNGRLARNLIEKICVLQTSRISANADSLTDAEFQQLTLADWPDDQSLATIH